MKVNFAYHDFKRVIYWIICKYKVDEYHYDPKCSKIDLIGGFLDRWLNRAPEFLVFNELLMEKEYDVVIDNFLYGQDTEKNSPDVIGLQNKQGDIIAVFTQFQNGNWLLLEDMPFIEVKTFKNNQLLVTIPESQMDEYRYYVIVESNVRDDYLTCLFEDSLFDDAIFESMQMNSEFIHSDEHKQIINPKKLSKDDDIGDFRLIGIYTGSEIKKYSVKAISIDGVPQKPRYSGLIDKIDIKREKINKNILEEDIHEGKYLHEFYDANGNPENNIPVSIEFIKHDSKVKLISKFKSYIIIKIQGEVKINNFIADDGFYRIEFKQLNRKSADSEYIGHRHLFEAIAEDVTSDLIERFDEIVNR